MTTVDLYDEDFYLWTQTQAEALRAEARRRGAAGGGSNAIDWVNLAEEVGDLGKSDLRECLSRARTIIEHLMKLSASARTEPRGGWLVTVKTQREDLKLVLTTSLRKRVSGKLPALHLAARDIVQTAFAAEEPGAVVDHAQAWSLASILGEADDPIA